MKILWYNKNIDILLNELKNYSISKKITKFILGGKYYDYRYWIKQKKQKQLKEVLEYDNNFINNLISKELDKIEENEQISKSEIKRIMKLSEKAKKSPMMSLEDFGKKWDFNWNTEYCYLNMQQKNYKRWIKIQVKKFMIFWKK